jgi:hypothetical protein
MIPPNPEDMIVGYRDACNKNITQSPTWKGSGGYLDTDNGQKKTTTRQVQNPRTRNKMKKKGRIRRRISGCMALVTRKIPFTPYPSC